MKPAFENIKDKIDKSAFVVYKATVPNFDFKWHYHPEYELTYIIDGFGKRIVGDSHKAFYSGDLVLLGSELPHTWYSEALPNEDVSAIVIQFSKEFLNQFLSFSEFKSVKNLFSKTHKGLFFNNPNARLIQLIKTLPSKTEAYRIIILLEIFQLLTKENYDLLTSEHYNPHFSKQTESRINKVCLFVENDYSKTISVTQAAQLLHLTESAFCKFFKRTMKTTFSDYVNTVRIDKACSKLTQTDKSIQDISIDCGFTSLTYFNRVFKQKKGNTPSNFRNSLFII